MQDDRTPKCPKCQKPMQPIFDLKESGEEPLQELKYECEACGAINKPN